MHVVHTAADPPNHGRINFAIKGWTWNSRNALVKMVSAKRAMPTARSAVRGDSGDALADDEGVDVVGSLIRFDCFEIA